MYMAVFDKKYGYVQERKEIVIESETIKVRVTRFLYGFPCSWNESHDCFRGRSASLIH